MAPKFLGIRDARQIRPLFLLIPPLSGESHRILLKIISQFCVELWVTSTQRKRPFKESFDGHSEKLDWITRSVGIEQGRNSSLVGSAQRRKLSSHNFAPSQLLLARRQSR